MNGAFLAVYTTAHLHKTQRNTKETRETNFETQSFPVAIVEGFAQKEEATITMHCYDALYLTKLVLQSSLGLEDRLLSIGSLQIIIVGHNDRTTGARMHPGFVMYNMSHLYSILYCRTLGPPL